MHNICFSWQTNSVGVVSQCGPMELLISKRKMADYEFLSMEVDLLEVTKWLHTINGTTIKKGDVIRVEILGIKWDPAQRTLSAEGSLLREYAGVDDRWPELKEATTTNQQQGDATHDGWGEPATNGDGGSGWGEPITTGAATTSVWGQLPLNEDTGNGGWGEPFTNEDDIGASGWD